MPQCVFKSCRNNARKSNSTAGVSYFSVSKGVSIINQLENARFEQFLKRIVTKMKIQDTEVFNEDETEKLLKIFQLDQESLLLAIKTIIFLFKRVLKYIFMPNDLKNDLKAMGFTNEKAEFMVKIWSTETRATLIDLGSEPSDKYNENLNFSWKINTELSSDYCKKTKVPKAYVLLSSENEDTEIELTHPELYSMFLQFEAIQNELDNIGI